MEGDKRPLASTACDPAAKKATAPFLKRNGASNVVTARAASSFDPIGIHARRYPWRCSWALFQQQLVFRYQ
eukprot:12900997-Prorocentrum_lima.AAC.1